MGSIYALVIFILPLYNHIGEGKKTGKPKMDKIRLGDLVLSELGNEASAHLLYTRQIEPNYSDWRLYTYICV